MVDDILSYIKVCEYTVGFVFDSGDTLSAFSKVSFFDESGTIVSAFVPGEDENILIPHANYFGIKIDSITSGPGFVNVAFANGRMITVQRIGKEAEVALLMLGSSTKVVI